MLRLIVIGIVILVAFVLLKRTFGPRPREPFRQEKPKVMPTDGGAVAAEIDGQELDIEPATLAEVRALATSGRKIEAIKRLRDATGLDLARAKDIVDALERLKK